MKYTPFLPRLPTDQNTYILGRIRQHSVVIASLPSGPVHMALHQLSGFHALHIGLMVGIGGGVLRSNSDIQLGDIVGSQPAIGHV